MIRFELLGGLRVLLSGNPLETILNQRRRCAISVYLATERSVGREAVLRIFWPDSDADNARHTLSQMIYQLRQTLGDTWLQVQGERLTVSDAVSSDVHEFETLAAAGDADAACELYHGPFLANVALVESAELEHWIDSKRAHYARLFRKTVREGIASRLAVGDLEPATALALRAAAIEPLEDEYHHQVIELLARAGKRTDALSHYEHYCRILGNADLSPLDHTQTLVEEIREGRFEPIARPTAPAVMERASAEGPVHDENRARPARRSRLWVLATFAVAAAASWVVWASFRSASTNPEVHLHPERVAVLPFHVSRGATAILEPSDLRTAVMAQLARSPQLEVAAVAGVDRSVESGAPLLEVSNDARSLILVSGNVTNDSVAVRLNVRILDGGTGRTLAMREFSASRLNPAALEQPVVDYLSEQLVSLLHILAYRRETKNPAARDLFNNALDRYRSASDLARTGQFEGALRALSGADSMLVRAELQDHEWVGATLLRMHVGYRATSIARAPPAKRTPAEVQQWFNAAIAQGDRALERDPGNVDVVEMRGRIRFEFWRWRAGEFAVNDVPLRRSAERDLQDAVMADYRRSRAWIHLAQIAYALGQFRQAKELALKALDVDPTSARDRGIYQEIAMASLESGHEVEALTWCDRGRRRFPDYPPMLYCESAVRAYGSNVPPDIPAAWRTVAALASTFSGSERAIETALFEMLAAVVIARAGLADSARAVAARAAAKAPASVSLMAPEAALWTRLGDYDRAITLLEQAAKQDPVWMLPTLMRQVFTPLRNDPRFESLLSRYQKF